MTSLAPGAAAAAAAAGPMPVIPGPSAIPTHAPSLAEQIERAIFAATRASTDPAPVGPPPRRTLGVGLGGHSLSSWPPGDLSTIPEGPASDAESSHALWQTQSRSGSESPASPRSADVPRPRPDPRAASPQPPWPLPTVSASSVSSTEPVFVTAQTAATDDDSARLSSAHSSVAVSGAPPSATRDNGSAAASNSIEFAPQPELTFGDFGESTSLRFVPVDAAAGDSSAAIAISSSLGVPDGQRESSCSIPLQGESDGHQSDATAPQNSLAAEPSVDPPGLLPEMAVHDVGRPAAAQDIGIATRLPLPASQSPSRNSGGSMPSSARDSNMPPYTIGPSSSEDYAGVPLGPQVPDPEPAESSSGPVPSPRITDLSLQGRDSVAAAAAAAAARAGRRGEMEGLSSSGHLNSVSTTEDQSVQATPPAAGHANSATRPDALAAHGVTPARTGIPSLPVPSPPASQDVDSGPLSGIQRQGAGAVATAMSRLSPKSPHAQTAAGAVAAAEAAAAAALLDSLGADSLPSITRRGAVFALGTASYDDSASLPKLAGSSGDVSVEASMLPYSSNGGATPGGSDPWFTSDAVDTGGDAPAGNPLMTGSTSAASERAPAAPPGSAYPANIPAPIGAAAAAVTLSPERISSTLGPAPRKDPRPRSLSAVPVVPGSTDAPRHGETGGVIGTGPPRDAPPAAPAAAAPDAPKPESAEPAVAADPAAAEPPESGGAEAAVAVTDATDGATAVSMDMPSGRDTAPAAAAPDKTAAPTPAPAHAAGPPAVRPLFSVRGLLVRSSCRPHFQHTHPQSDPLLASATRLMTHGSL